MDNDDFLLPNEDFELGSETDLEESDSADDDCDLRSILKIMEPDNTPPEMSNEIIIIGFLPAQK